MLDQTLTLPEDPEELRSFTARLLAEVKAQAILIEKLRHQLAGHRAHRFDMGDGVERLLVVRGPTRPTPIGAADVGSIAEGADHAAVEHHQVAGADHPARRFLLPGGVRSPEARRR